MKFADTFKKIFFPLEDSQAHFELPDVSSSDSINEAEIEEFSEVKDIFPSIDVNIEYIRVKYNLLINSDICLREFTLSARNK